MASNAGSVEEIVHSQPSIGRRVAIIDDAFIPLSLERISNVEREAVVAALALPEVRTELAAYEVDPAAPVGEILEALTEPERPFGVAFEFVLQSSKDLGRLIEERHFIKGLARLVQDHTGHPIVTCDPRSTLPDLTSCDLVLVDYYLEGSSGTGDLAKALAGQVRDQAGRPPDQQIVLMSSFEDVRAHRAEFRNDARLSGSSFAFVAKLDMDERWKVKAHFGMLDRARPHAPVLEGYRGQLVASLEAASRDLLQIAADLDIGDYAYLQSQALMSDGHPLGDYVSWLLSSHLTTLAFENQDVRSAQRAVDRLEFERRTFAATEPSPVVANLFHNALLSSNQGALGPHPRAKPDTTYARFPLVQLGDVFLNLAKTKAIVVLSADCDLAFSPAETRAPHPDTPVILVPGEPKSLMSPIDEQFPAHTEGLMAGGQVYRIDWIFSGYRSVPLGQLKDWLEREGFDISNRDRLRALFALKLQQEFGAHLFRVGPPIMPPLTFAAEGNVYITDKIRRDKFDEFSSGDIMLSHHKGEVIARLTPKLVDVIRRASQNLLVELEAKLAARPPRAASPNGAAPKVDPDQMRIDALRRDVESDDFWIVLVDGVVLNAPGTLLDRGSACSFVRGDDWQSPGKLRVVLEIVERSSSIVEEAVDHARASAPAASSEDA